MFLGKQFTYSLPKMLFGIITVHLELSRYFTVTEV